MNFSTTIAQKNLTLKRSVYLIFILGSVVLLLLILFLNIFSTQILSLSNRVVVLDSATETISATTDTQTQQEVFILTILNSNNNLWQNIFAKINSEYDPPSLFLFDGVVSTSCGPASSSTGSFYCPLDSTIYLESGLTDSLAVKQNDKKLALVQSYIISHEIAHHVQNLLGVIPQVILAGRNNNQVADDLSTKLELQADCFTGLWANSVQVLGLMDATSVNESMLTLTESTKGNINEIPTGRNSPENWQYASADQKLYWFNQGFNSGNLEVCDTFKQ